MILPDQSTSKALDLVRHTLSAQSPDETELYRKQDLKTLFPP